MTPVSSPSLGISAASIGMGPATQENVGVATSESVCIPQFAYAVTLDKETWKSLGRLQDRVVREYARNDEEDSVYFGPNASLWFKSLFQRDVGELGADAIVTSGSM